MSERYQMNRGSSFPPPILLPDLVSAIGVDGVHDLALNLCAIEIAAKVNQVWRVTLHSQVIIGYERSAVIAGRDALAMELVSALLHATVMKEDAEIRNHARILDLALLARDIFAIAEHTIDVQAYIPRYLTAITRIIDMDDVDQHSLFRALLLYAPKAARALELALAVYTQGATDGMDMTETHDEQVDDHVLPDMPF